MSHISQIELQNLRHIISDVQLTSTKASVYADAATHPELQKIFTQGAREAQSDVEKLKRFLQ